MAKTRDVVCARGGLSWHDATVLPHPMQPAVLARCVLKECTGKESLAAGDVMRARGGLVWHEATVLPHQMQPGLKARRHRPASRPAIAVSYHEDEHRPNIRNDVKLQDMTM